VRHGFCKTSSGFKEEIEKSHCPQNGISEHNNGPRGSIELAFRFPKEWAEAEIKIYRNSNGDCFPLLATIKAAEPQVKKHDAPNNDRFLQRDP